MATTRRKLEPSPKTSQEINDPTVIGEDSENESAIVATDDEVDEVDEATAERRLEEVLSPAAPPDEIGESVEWNLAGIISAFRRKRANGAKLVPEGGYVRVLVDGRLVGQVAYPTNLKRMVRFNELRAEVVKNAEYVELLRRFCSVNDAGIIGHGPTPDGGRFVLTADGAKYMIDADGNVKA